MSQRSKSRVLITLSLVFLAGVGTGMVVMRYGLHDQLRRSAEQGTAPVTAEERAKAVGEQVEQFRKELDLTPDQTTQLAAVIKDYDQYFDSVQAQMEDLRLREQIDDLRSTGKDRILRILNPEQRAKFETIHIKPPAATK